MEILIPGSIRKDQINGIAAHNGQVSSKTLVLNGLTCEAGKIMFRFFRGAINMSTRLYDGHYVFTDEVAKGAETYDLNAIFVDAKKPAATTKKKET